jgi:hypothetical protein
MKPDILLKLLRNIRDLKYPVASLKTVDDLETTLANDLNIDRSEAMAMLGYLLKNSYVRITPDLGIVLNPTNDEVRRLLESGQLR